MKYGPVSGAALALTLLAVAGFVLRAEAEDILGIQILQNGDVGVGTSEPQADFHVVGDSLTTGTIQGGGDDRYGQAAVVAGYDTGGGTARFAVIRDSRFAGGAARIVNLENGIFKTFVIDHPVDSARYLVHAAVEGPEGGVFYRGSARLEGGRAVVELPSYFEALTHRAGRTVLLTPTGGLDPLAVRSTVDGLKIADGRFTVYSSNPLSDQAFDWEVKAVRRDVPPLRVEPPRTEVEVLGFGPYVYARPQGMR